MYDLTTVPLLGTIEAFLTTVATLSAAAFPATELIKRTIKNRLKVDSDILNVIISIVCSLGAAIPTLSSGLLTYILTATGVAFSINGIFKAVHKS